MLFTSWKGALMNHTVLIVEDSGSTRLHLKNVLSNEYNCIFACSGEEMWEILPKSIPSILLLDIIMPGESGFDIILKLSKRDEYRNIPVIFLTGLDGSAEAVKGFEIGAFDYIRKPFNEEELKARIKSVLRIKDHENRLRLHSVTDYLTGIYNRRYFFEAAKNHLHYSSRSGKNACIAMLDLDHFKDINDTMGHDAGDFVLKRFTEMVKIKIRPYDIFARHGGEEFVILFSDCEKEKCIEILERIRTSLATKEFSFKETPVKFTFSAGIVSLDDEPKSVTVEQLVHHADSMLYKAKESGRNRIVHYEKDAIAYP
jgi:two-component system, cell cycle response regulator